MENKSKEIFKVETNLRSIRAIESNGKIILTAQCELTTNDGQEHAVILVNSIPISKLA